VASFRIENRGARSACLFGLDQTRAPFVLFLDADDELKPNSLGTIIDRLDPGVAKLQFPLTRIDANGTVISGAFPTLLTFRARHALARRVLSSGTYKSPPTSGNIFRRDLCEFLREASYDRFVDGVMPFAAPLLGDIVSISEEIGYYRIHDRNDSGIGRIPNIVTIKREIELYLARMQHLHAIIRKLRPGHSLFDPRDTFYFLERQFCLDVASGRRPKFGALLRLALKLLGEPSNVKKTSPWLRAIFCARCCRTPSARPCLLIVSRSAIVRQSVLCRKSLGGG
jgi:glycosyltransferase involved in cell wall biosynthesis